MQSGQVAVVHGEFDEIPTDEFPVSKKDGLKTSISIRDTITNQSGDKIIIGTAANQIKNQRDTADITETGEIQEDLTEKYIETISTTFVTIPGEFVVIGNSNANFVFDLIGQQTETMVEEAEFNLDATLSDYTKSDGNIWMSGFYNHSGDADTGVAYGDNIVNDQKMGEIIADGNNNQLGLTFERGENKIKMMITESGYMRIYSPSEFGTPSFVRIVKEFISRYIDITT
jgi:hypothetical protein